MSDDDFPPERWPGFDKAEAERAAARADPRQTGLFDKRQTRLSVKGGETMRKRSVPVTLAGKPR